MELKRQINNQDDSTNVRIFFVLLEKNWQFANFDIELKLTNPMLIVQQKIKENHGRIEDISFYEDKKNLVYDFRDTVQKVFKAFKRTIKNEITVYYDFNNGYSCPLLLS